MSIIRVENLTFSYPSSIDNVFENLNFQIDTDWNLGFIGKNGRGKTTFLKLLMGEYEYSGQIHSSVKFDYFPYSVKDKNLITKEILTCICCSAEEWQIKKELSLLEVKEDVLFRPFKTLSEGEQTKVLLAALFLNENRFLLIDEPTNHLDERARTIVSEYLKSKKGFILVSHDRYFLDECIDHVLSINRSNIEVKNGNYSIWQENFKKQLEFEQSKNTKLKKEINNMQKAAKRTSKWSDVVESTKFGNGPVNRGYIGHKSAKMMKRSKAIEIRKNRAIEEKSSLLKNFEIIEDLKIRPITYCSDILISFSEVVPVFDGEEICKPVSFEVNVGDRIAIEGTNGSGKTSLLKILMGYDIEYEGCIKKGSDLKISYVSQDTSYLKGNLTEFCEKERIDESVFKTLLKKMGFLRVHFSNNIENFSDGQKKKVLIAKSLCERAHLYVWDEPLNYVDMDSRIQIEELIEEFSPTILFIEHDRFFSENISTKKIHIESIKK